MVRSFVLSPCLRACGRPGGVRIQSVRFGQLLQRAHKRNVNIMNVYMERKNRQLELIRFRNKNRIDSFLLFRSNR